MHRGPSKFVAFFSAGIACLAAERAAGQCDPGVAWEIFEPTGDVAEILVEGEVAWVGARGGVIRIETAGVSGGDPVQSKIGEREGLISSNITAMARDQFGNLWVGTREDGISVFDAQGRHVENLSAFSELWSDRVLAIGGQGNRMFVTSANDFSPQGNPEGGGYVIVTVTPRTGGGFEFARNSGTMLEVGRDVHVSDGFVWFGTSGQGLWVRDETVIPSVTRVAVTEADGLASNNVKKIIEAPHYPSGDRVLWLGTGTGLQSYDPATGAIESLAAFDGRNILDLYERGNTLWVLAELGESRDLYTVDLTVAPVARRIPRVECSGDTLYVPRRVAVDAAGRVILGTRSNGFAVRESLDWYCPPPLGPHHTQAADIWLHPNGSIYFATGDEDRQVRGNGVGVYDGIRWTAITRDDGILHPDMTEVLVWGDGTVWFGSSVDANNGGLNRYFPELGTLEAYHNTVPVDSRRTLGRNVRSLETDAAGNLWVCYGQGDPPGGLSVIEAGSLRITNYNFGFLFPGRTTLLRDLAFDSAGHVWVCTHLAADPAKIFVVDTRGTVANLADDRLFEFDVTNDLGLTLGECKDIEIDSKDRIWVAGERGLVLGELDPGSWPPDVAWRRIVPTATQAAGRDPLPYEVARVDWEDNIWLGTETSGLFRISRDLATWTWFDQAEGCPLPDQAIRGLHVDNAGRRVLVATGTGAIARLDLSAARSPGTGERLDPEPYPNPWNPEEDGPIRFATISPDQTVDLRIWTLGGELVHERLGLRGEKNWNGRTLTNAFAEPGVYVVSAVSTGGATWEGKFAVLR